MNLQNRVAIVTGGSGGLGRTVCRVLADAGARVVIADRTDPALEGTHFVQTDLLAEKSIEALVAATLKLHGRIEILVNLAGGFRPGPVTKTTGKDLDAMLDLNLKSAFLTCKQVVPVMVGNKYGRIVNTAARVAVLPGAGMAAYTISKAAVASLTQSLANEVRDAGITVNAIMPSTIDTPANRKDMPDADFSTWVTPASLASVIRFLVSDDAADVSGALLPVYGRA